MIQKHTVDCGCEITVYSDGSAPPDITFCGLHWAANDLLEALRDVEATMIRNGGQDHPRIPGADAKPLLRRIRVAISKI